MVFATKLGLEKHLRFAKKNSCGQEAHHKKKLARIEESRERKKAIYSEKIKRIGPHLKNVSRPHKRGAPLTKEEKELVLKLYDEFRGTYVQLYSKVPQCGNLGIFLHLYSAQ